MMRGEGKKGLGWLDRVRRCCWAMRWDWIDRVGGE